MQGQILAPAPRKRVHRLIVPYIRPVAAMAPKLDRIEVSGASDPVGEYQFVLGTIERAHPGIALIPDAKIQELAIDRPAHSGEIVHVAPVHANEVDRAV